MEPDSTFSSDLNRFNGLHLTSSYTVIPSQSYGALVLNDSGELDYKIETGSRIAYSVCRKNIFVVTYGRKEPGWLPIRVFDLDQKQKERSLTGPDEKSYEWSLPKLRDDAKILAVGTHHGELMVWNLDSEISTPSLIIPVGRGVIISMKIHDENIVTSNEDGTVQVWNLSTGVCLHTLEGHSKWVTTGLFDQDGRLATSDFAGLTKVWNLEDGSASLTYDLQTKISASLFVTREKLVAVSPNGSIHVWNRVTLALERVVPTCSTNVGISQGKWTGNGNILVTSGFDSNVRTIQIWDLDCDDERPLLKVPVYGMVSRLGCKDKMIAVLSVGDGPGWDSDTAAGREFKVEFWNLDTLINEAKKLRE